MRRVLYQRSSSSSGSVLVPVLVLLTGVLVMGFAVSRSTLSEQKSTRESLEDRRAFYLAEAGLHEAYEAVRTGRSGNVGSPEEPAYLAGGLLWVTMADLGNDRRQLTSTGLAGRGRYALEAVIHVKPDDPPLFVATLNSKETLTLNEGVLIDSYDSSLGSYASQAVNVRGTQVYAGANGDVRSNQDIVMNARASAYGDAIPGPEHGVSMATESYVDGAIVPAEEPFVFPDIEYPVFPPLGNYSVPTLTSATLAPGNYDFDSFSIQKSATLTVTGPATIVVDDFEGGKLASLKIDATNGPVTFFVRNTYLHTSGFTASAVGSSPMLVAFMIGGAQDVVFPALTAVRGAYYAPNADILFASGNECWGAFAANRISMSNDMRFHFDEGLLEHWGGKTGDEGDRLTVLSWRKAAVTPASLIADRRDPLAVLGLEARELLSPGQAWKE